MRVLTLYTKPGCHLCDEALKTLREICAELLAETGMLAGGERPPASVEGECLPAPVETGMRGLPASVELRVRDITAEESLHRAYFERIPVVALDGEELFEYFVDAETLRERLRGPSL